VDLPARYALVRRCDPVRRARHINEVGTFRNGRCLMSPEASIGGMMIVHEMMNSHPDVHTRPADALCDASNIVTGVPSMHQLPMRHRKGSP
jgi:hypothetical protein